MPELRRDPVVGRWVIISTERARRPSDFVPRLRPRKGGPCVFCGGQEAQTPEEVWALRPGRGEPNTPGWLLRVVPNKFPALRIEGELEPSGEGLYDRMNGVGAHEVVIETPEHEAVIEQLPVSHLGEVFRSYRDRIVDLSKDPRLEYVMVFKNHGDLAGASLEHTHSQLVATPVVPLMVEEEISIRDLVGMIARQVEDELAWFGESHLQSSRGKRFRVVRAVVELLRQSLVHVGDVKLLEIIVTVECPVGVDQIVT